MADGSRSKGLMAWRDWLPWWRVYRTSWAGRILIFHAPKKLSRRFGRGEIGLEMGRIYLG